MKKLLISLICLLTLCVANVHADEIELPEVTDHEKVTIYIFRGNGCGFCKKALTYFNENASKYSDYLEVKTYEVYNNSANSTLMNAVGQHFGDDTGGVPYIVVGSTYHDSGFTDALGEEMVKAALTEYQNKDYKDVVSEIAEEHSSAKITTLYDACVEDGIIVVERDKSNDAWIVLAIFAVIIGGGVGLIALSRKK